MTHKTPRVVVVGAGAVGLAVAWRLAAADMTVTVCDPAPAQGSSRAAAGMLAPVTEATALEAPLVRLGLASLRQWEAFAAAVAKDADLEGPPALGLRTEGTLQVAFDEDDRRQLSELAQVHQTLGLDSRELTGRQCRGVAPNLSPRVRAGLSVPGDWQVDPRLLLSALMAALVNRGGYLRQAAVRRVVQDSPPAPVSGVELAGGERLEAEAVVLAAGATLCPPALPAGLSLPVRPVKGEILRLRDEPGDPAVPMTIRASVQGQPVYLVPRHGGELVVGATMQEAGHDRTVRAGAVLELLRAAVELVPVVGELELVEASAGLRPATPDNGPLLGPTPVPGLHVASGHFRNGILLAPLTAEALLASVRGEQMPPEAAEFGLGRFG
jgi:glycine oxidase